MKFVVVLFAAFVALAPAMAQAPAGAPAVQTSQVPAQIDPMPGHVTIVAPAQPTQVSVGTLAGNVLNWFVVVFGTVISPFIVKWLLALAKTAGVASTDALRDRLQEAVENGLALAAKEAQQDLKGKLTVEIKNKVAQRAVAYAQDHAADTIKALGLDPNDPKAVEALQARAQTALNNIQPPAAVVAVAAVDQPKTGG